MLGFAYLAGDRAVLMPPINCIVSSPGSLLDRDPKTWSNARQGTCGFCKSSEGLCTIIRGVVKGRKETA